MQKMYAWSLLFLLISTTLQGADQRAVMAPEHAAQIRAWRTAWHNASNYHNTVREEQLGQAQSMFVRILHNAYNTSAVRSELLHNLRDQQQYAVMAPQDIAHIKNIKLDLDLLKYKVAINRLNHLHTQLSHTIFITTANTYDIERQYSIGTYKPWRITGASLLLL